MEVTNSMVQLTRGYVWMTSGSLVIKLLAFININLVLWTLTAYQFGAVELALSLMSIPSLLLFSGLSSTIVADVAAHRSRNESSMARSILMRFLMLSIIGGVAAFIAVIVFARYFGTLEGKGEVQLFLQVAALGLLTTPFRMAIQNIFSAFGAFSTLSIFTVVEEIAKMIGILLFVIFLQKGALGLIAAIVFSQAVPVVVFAVRAYGMFLSLDRSSESVFNPLLLFQGHRLWSLANSTLGLATKPVRLWIIKLFLGTEAVGLFAFAFGVFGHISGLVTVSQVFAPLAAKHAHAADIFKKLIHSATKYQLLLSASAALVFAPVVAVVVPILYPNFTGALPIVYWMLVALVPTGILSLCTPIFIALREQRSQFISGLLRTVFLVIFASILYPTFGIAGIGMELLVTLLVSLWERDRRLRILLGTKLIDVANIVRYTTEDALLVSAIVRKLRSLLSQRSRLRDRG